MPTLLEHESRTPQALAWTREDCRRMEEIGLLPARWELVRGEVISKIGQRVPHGQCVRDVLAWLMRVYGQERLLSQVTIDVSPADNPTSEPEPDIIVLSQPSSSLAGNPRPQQILLLVEVSDTTLSYDLKQKGSLYAEAGIPEYWVIDLRSQELHQHQQPVLGKYQSIAILRSADPIQAAGQTTPIAALLGLP